MLIIALFWTFYCQCSGTSVPEESGLVYSMDQEGYVGLVEIGEGKGAWSLPVT